MRYVFPLLILLAATFAALCVQNRKLRDTEAQFRKLRSDAAIPHVHTDWFIGGTEQVSDSQGIQTAIDVASKMTRGGAVWFSPRTYRLTASIDLRNSNEALTLVGNGCLLDCGGMTNHWVLFRATTTNFTEAAADFTEPQ